MTRLQGRVFSSSQGHLETRTLQNFGHADCVTGHCEKGELGENLGIPHQPVNLTSIVLYEIKARANKYSLLSLFPRQALPGCTCS